VWENVASEHHLGELKEVTPVSGGDINEAYKLSVSSGKSYFVKCNSSRALPDLFEKEIEGLIAIKKTGICTPKVIGSGKVDQYIYLVLEYLSPDVHSSWKALAETISKLHTTNNNSFGWKENNYIGSLPQTNNRTESWAEFYLNQRLLPLLEIGRKEGKFSSPEGIYAEILGNRIESSFPSEKPCLLHGDLWSGNVHFSGGKAYLIDPAVYYGNREVDIAMTKLFGGFPNEFYQHYEELNALQEDWKERIECYQLYPLLVHAILFGGSYVNQCKQILKKWA
jgi:fructosamine-3-kinase